MSQEDKKINIWEYVGAENIQITCTTGEIFEGDVVCVDDVEELYDAEEPCDAVEDEITIETPDGKFIGFRPSEILEIKRK
ncbi:MAG: hypothetical protein HDT27_11165 [Subdoligranulum sp.]|nr:hypothetical protein [Subdoligranulum sp.]